MRDMSNMVDEDIEELRKERNAKMNPPKFDIGQSDNDSDWGDIFGSSSDSSFTSGDSFFGGGNDSSFFGGGGSDFFGGGGFQSQPQQSQQDKIKEYTATEDKIIDAVVKGSKVAYTGSKTLVGGLKEGLRGKDARYWCYYGRVVFTVGSIVGGIGLVLMLLGFGDCFWVMVGGLLSLGTGFVVLSLNIDRSRELKSSDVYEDDEEIDLGFGDEESIGDGSGESSYFDDIFDNGNGGSNESSDWGDIDSNWGFNDYEEVDEVVVEEEENVWDAFNGSDFDVESRQDVEDVDIDTAISNIREIPAHTQTRQYLFEEFNRVLPLVNPEFAELKVISENSDNFLVFDKIVSEASLQLGVKEEKLPCLSELRENQFIIQLKCTRPSGIPEDKIANEIANIYSRDDYGAIKYEGVYATTSSVGSNFIINIFKGQNSVVSLADTYREVKDFVLDTSIKKPIVMGVNELGKVWTFDAEKIFSYIISGKPRSGKSWSVVSLILQLCMYSSPKEVTFEVFDVKDTSSDYYNMKGYLPHFKRFESKGNLILQRLRHLTTVEADRRKKILKQNDVIAIADLKSKGVDIELPYLYVVIDEIVGLIGKFSKDEHKEFKDLVNVLITQMPNLGIRLILIPHRVTDDIVPKTTYTNVGCIACVRSDLKEITNTLDITKISIFILI